MFGILKSVTKAVVGIVVSPIDIAMDIATLGGTLSDRDEPYTVSRVKQVMRNCDHAVDPETLTEDELEEIVRRLNR